MEIPGYPTTVGVGRLFIMAAGYTAHTEDGDGFRAMNGDPLGLNGDQETDIMVGHP